jgi:hypothetical protein
LSASPSGTDTVTGTNIAYTMHFYAGEQGSWLRDRTKAAAVKVPIFVSEFGGMNADGDGPIATNERNACISLLEALEISYVVWSVETKAESSSILPVTGSWSQLKEWGNIVKHLITAKQ